MHEYQYILADFLQHSKEIAEQAKTIRSNMEENEVEQLEALQGLFEKRQDLLQQLAEFIQHADFKWTEDDKQVLQQLKAYDDMLQPLLNNLHQSFLAQMNRVSQTKQVSTKYMGAYQNLSSEGSFIDKRK